MCVSLCWMDPSRLPLALVLGLFSFQGHYLDDDEGLNHGNAPQSFPGFLFGGGRGDRPSCLVCVCATLIVSPDVSISHLERKEGLWGLAAIQIWGWRLGGMLRESKIELSGLWPKKEVLQTAQSQNLIERCVRTFLKHAERSRYSTGNASRVCDYLCLSDRRS